MAKWGNALGGYRTQRRDSDGQFASGSSSSRGSIKSSSKHSSRSKSSSKSRASKSKTKSKNSSFKKDLAKRAAITLAVAGAATYGASVAFNGRQETHSRIMGSFPKIKSSSARHIVKPIASSKMRAPSGSIANPMPPAPAARVSSQAQAIIKDIERQSAELNDFLNQWERENRNNARGPIYKPASTKASEARQATTLNPSVLSGIIAQDLPGAKKPKRRRR